MHRCAEACHTCLRTNSCSMQARVLLCKLLSEGSCICASVGGSFRHALSKSAEYTQPGVVVLKPGAQALNCHECIPTLLDPAARRPWSSRSGVSPATTSQRCITKTSPRGCQAAAFAQNWAARCVFQHSGSRSYGENLYLSSIWQGEAAAVTAWYSVCPAPAPGSGY